MHHSLQHGQVEHDSESDVTASCKLAWKDHLGSGTAVAAYAHSSWPPGHLSVWRVPLVGIDNHLKQTMRPFALTHQPAWRRKHAQHCASDSFTHRSDPTDADSNLGIDKSLTATQITPLHPKNTRQSDR